MTRPRLLLTCLLVLSACAAPASYRPDAAPAWDRTVPALPPVLTVHNDHGSSMTLFLIVPGHRYFLGEVGPGRRARFQLPRELVRTGSVQVLARARGRALEYLTDPLRFDRGHNLELGIRKNLFGSRIRIR